MTKPQPWIFSARFDIALILSPAIVISLLVIFFSGNLEAVQDVPPWLWLVLIVGVDVSHVYSTIFRTYLNREELRERAALYTLTPLLAWFVGCMLYSIDAMLFWRVLAYLAVFHFIRQQYGFMMIYARRERNMRALYRQIDKAAIYAATLYPLIYWHCYQRSFEWFIKGDFVSFLDAPHISLIAGGMYVGILAVYSVKEVAVSWQTGEANIPKNLLLFGTALSWFVGIVAFNNDLAFTATNVIAHGIPYMALIWAYGRNQAVLEGGSGRTDSYLRPWMGKVFTWKAVPVYLAVLFMLAFMEEILWDGFVWHEHEGVLVLSGYLAQAGNAGILKWLVPLLAVPQITHYVLDAFIWRMQTEGTEWGRILFLQRSNSA